MSLREQMSLHRTQPQAAGTEPAGAAHSSVRNAYQKLRREIHLTVLDRVELERLSRLPQEQVRQEISSLISRILDEERLLANDIERRQLAIDVYDEMFGFGPLESLLRDPGISDILVNTYRQVYVERSGQLELTDVTFYDDAHLMKVIEKIVSRVGRRIDESTPMVDARLPDGSRVNAIIPPSAIDGPLMSIRRFAVNPLKMDDLVSYQSLTPPMAELLDALARAKVNVLVSGGTGSGKTTLLNILSGFIPRAERIVTIEDAAELQLQQPHVLRLETRPPNIEGKGEITQRTLVRNALRMRPDRIILGEVRGAEALDMLNAMNTGHEGSMATIHANNPREAIGRLEQMIAMGGLAISPDAMRQQIASAIGLIIQVMRLADGKRKVTHVTEITGMEGQVVQMQDIFTFNRTHTDADGTVHGEFRATGLRPRCIDEMQRRGIAYDASNFDPTRVLGAS